VAAIGSPLGHKGMLVAAKVLALSTVELLGDAGALREAKADLEKRVKGRKYTTRIPKGQKAPKSIRREREGEAARAGKEALAGISGRPQKRNWNSMDGPWKKTLPTFFWLPAGCDRSKLSWSVASGTSTSHSAV